MIDLVNETEELKDEDSENDQLASNYTFGEFYNQSTPHSTLYNCGNEMLNCTEESDTGGYFYKVCRVGGINKVLEIREELYYFDSQLGNKNKTKRDFHFTSNSYFQRLKMSS